MIQRLVKGMKKTPQMRRLVEREAEHKAKFEAYQRRFDAFYAAFGDVKARYLSTKNLPEFEEKLREIAREYFDIDTINLIYFECAQTLSEMHDDDAEIMIYRIMEQELKYYSINEMDMYLKSAHYYFTRGDEVQGREWLFKLCREDCLPTNYEEAMEWRKLTELWDKYGHYLDGKIPPSVPSFQKAAAIAPEDCTLQITDIFAQKEDDLLLNLSNHLYEMSGQGDSMNYLNKWERVFFDVDNMVTDIGSDGIPHFLTSHGHRFTQTRRALEIVGAEKALQLIDMIAAYFPKGKVPKSDEKREMIVNDIMDSEESFDAAEAFYENQNIECELVDAEYRFALANKNKFR